MHKMFWRFCNPHFRFPCYIFSLLLESIFGLKGRKEDNVCCTTRFFELTFYFSHSYFVPFSSGVIGFNEVQQVFLVAICHDIRQLVMFQDEKVYIFQCFFIQMQELICCITYIKYFCTETEQW